MNLSLIQNYAQQILASDVSGHDYWHLQRVAHLAQNLARQEQQLSPQQNDLLLASSYLHDTIDEKLVPDVQQALLKGREILRQAGLQEEQVELVTTAIQHLSYAANLEGPYPLPLFAQYVQDADRLDALGAIGIARAFAYGASHQQPIYDPHIPPIKLHSKTEYRQHQTSTINHFYEKLLSLQETMNTSAGQKIAQQRTKILTDFLAEFQAEWRGEK
ncbi:HD domain-containing protein [Lactobacillus sp. DCY120]|uniref:HD domain-containing protein n=1 Tax=Bombilactobacillus apium TaxID=2675299 RepID=A0A850QYY3_9LACO|nr:HD domain-containing protein [Bombilactobacillus apium]NVY95959.1 HD domain-containing protein [Bombilactobacillus apium]